MNWEEIIKAHNVRKIYHEADLNKNMLLPQQMLEMAKRWVRAPKKPSLFLSGPVGSGKTYLMTALLRALVEQGHTWFKFTRSVDLFEELMQNFLHKKTNEYNLKSIAEVPFLFIDDVGVESMTEHVKKEYFYIIDHRIGEMLPFIFTSNMSKEEFGWELGERIQSRMHLCMEIEFPARDFRKEMNLFNF